MILAESSWIASSSKISEIGRTLLLFLFKPNLSTHGVNLLLSGFIGSSPGLLPLIQSNIEIEYSLIESP